MSKHRAAGNGRAITSLSLAAGVAAAALTLAGCGAHSVRTGAEAGSESGAASTVRISQAAPMPSTTPAGETAKLLAARSWAPAILPAGYAPTIDSAVRQQPAAARSRLAANRLYIPSLGVYAPVDLAHAAGGELDLPSDASRVARYDASPDFAARSGTTIVAGHVTNTPQIGALFPLATIKTNALIYTSDSRGRLRAWKVLSVSAPLKAQLPHTIFTASGPRRLAIVTCGGEVTWNTNGTRSYPRNIVVLAKPVMTN